MNQTVTWSPVSRDSTIESSSQLLPILYGSDMMSMVDDTTMNLGYGEKNIKEFLTFLHGKSGR